jgi:hypothetical protein
MIPNDSACGLLALNRCLKRDFLPQFEKACRSNEEPQVRNKKRVS